MNVIARLALISVILVGAAGYAADAEICAHVADPLQALRFAKHIAVFRDVSGGKAIPAKDLDKTIDRLVEKDARAQLFRLEGLVRLYDSIYEADLAPFLAKVKKGEDAIGGYTEKLEYLEFAKKVGAPPRALRVLEKDTALARSRLKAALPVLMRSLIELETALGKVEWKKPRKDTRAVIGELAAEIRKYERREYDMSELQLGVHEARRNFRWILIYAQALDGLIILQNSSATTKLSEYSYLESHPIASSPFSKIEPNPLVKKPVPLPVRYFLALSKVVSELGAIKSSGENLEALAGAFRRSGVARSSHSAHRLALELAVKDPKFVGDFEVRARQVQKELERTKLLKRIRKALEHGAKE